MSDSSVMNVHRMELADMYMWYKTWNFLPKRCAYTEESIPPFSTCYIGKRWLHGRAGTPPLRLNIWTTPEIYTMLLLKNKGISEHG